MFLSSEFHLKNFSLRSAGIVFLIAASAYDGQRLQGKQHGQGMYSSAGPGRAGSSICQLGPLSADRTLYAQFLEPP